MKIAHLADIHIRSLQYMDEINYTFDRLYEKLEVAGKPQVDHVVIAGDLFHNKLTVSNEYFVTCHKFLKRLSTIAPTTIIPGNHDLAIQNQTRLDAITPVVDSIKSKNIHYNLKSYSRDIGNSFVFHHFSCLEEKSLWPQKEILDKSKINIALYHGSINGSSTDLGWVSRGNRDDIDIFNEFDFAFLGDIHKKQFLNSRIAYPGSLRQNNYGEDLEKGFLLWDIKSKDEFRSEYVILPQKKYFFTIHLADQNVPKDLGIPQNNRVRVVLAEQISYGDRYSIKNKIKELYRPCNDVPIQPPKYSSFEKSIGERKKEENYRDIETSKKLLKSYFSGSLVENKVDKIFEIDKIYHSEINTDVLRNVQWDIEWLKFDNVFSYGENNFINFNKLGGITGILGPTGAGKSSIIDTLCFIIQNSINRKGATKNVEYINSSKDFCSGEIELTLNNKKFVIYRKTEKKITKKGEEKANNEISFYQIVDGKKKGEEGESLPETNKKIKNYFGTLEDFNSISLISQFGLTELIDAGSTDRKKIISKFLDLGVFSEKFDLANKDFAKIKAKLEDLDQINYDDKISALKERLNRAKRKIINLEKQQKVLHFSKKSLDDSLYESQKSLFLVDDLLDESLLETQTTSYKQQLSELNQNLKLCKFEIDKTKNKLEENLKVDEIKELLEKEEKRINNAKIARDDLKKLRKSLNLLEDIPNVAECKSCVLVSDLYQKREKDLPILEEQVQKFNFEDKEKILKLRNQLKEVESLIAQLNLVKKQENEFSVKLARLEEKIHFHEEKIKEFKKNKEKIAQNQTTKEKIEETKEKVAQVEKKLKECVEEVKPFYLEQGSLENNIRILEKKKKQYEITKNRYDLYRHYLDAMGKNGIGYLILSQKIKFLNQEVNHILSQVSDLSISIDNNEETKSLDISIYKKGNKTNIQLASGGEKSLIAIALRSALWNISSLPKAPILILDESFAFLDDSYLDSISSMLQYLKNYFKHIFIMSHNQDIKGIVDHSIYITKEDGYSKCEVK